MQRSRTAAVIAAAGIALAVAVGASAQQVPAPGTRSAPGQAKLASADRDFVLTAAKGGMAEVALGELAGMNAKNDAVKRFGQRMVADHGKANQALADLAQEKGVELPKDVDRAHKGVQDRLAKLQGDAFDRAYVEEMVKDHRTNHETGDTIGVLDGELDPFMLQELERLATATPAEVA